MKNNLLLSLPAVLALDLALPFLAGGSLPRVQPSDAGHERAGKQKIALPCNL